MGSKQDRSSERSDKASYKELSDCFFLTFFPPSFNDFFFAVAYVTYI